MYTKRGLSFEKCNIQMGYNEPMGLYWEKGLHVRFAKKTFSYE